MNKKIFLILLSAITIVLAEKPSWYPKNFEAISEKCHEEYHLAPDAEIYVNNKSIDKSKVYDVFLCKAKAINIYNEKTGFYVDRLKYFFSSRSNLKCEALFVKECVNKNEEIASHGEKIYKVVNCITEKEKEMLKKGC